ncbi:MAG: hypothetical protein OXI69_13875 [Acidobacteriota bacterium]|nr:hypothetical protein [Acidobacteriota bacterium]
MAVTITAEELRQRVSGVAETHAAQLRKVAKAIVEAEAPNAPSCVQNEAVVRLAGYLAQSDFGGIVEEELGAKRVEYAVNHAAMFHRSGAKGLLSRWKRRRAGAI